jgi:exosortase A-associated hydrolase 2
MPDECAALPALEAFQLAVRDGRRFAVLRAPTGPARGALVYVHPFAEEMNKSRRMAALGARALVANGWAVLALDLAGCGDSEGDFADATWQGWVDDVAVAATWLAGHAGHAPWLWGLRAGCLVAVEAAQRLASVAGLLLWQPVVSGSQHLRQFLRLRVAADALATNPLLPDEGSAPPRRRDDTAAFVEQLRAGSTIEVAGYTLAPALASGLDAAKLEPVRAAMPVVWLEVGGSDPATAVLSPASARAIEGWRSAGHAVDAQAVAGPAFWQTQEIEECPSLVAATVTALAAHAERS